MRSHAIAPAKGLGQHFLCSASVVEAIIAAVIGCRGVLEIGPGPGVLTDPISRQCDQMIALEVDLQMVTALADSAPAADVRRLDALKQDLNLILAELPMPRAVVSNLPYYITGPLLAKIADARSEFDLAVLMMQKEVAARITAKPGDGKRGSLSVSIQRQFEVSLVVRVAAADFMPPPKVDSTVLRFVPRATLDDKVFGRMLRFGFAQPRKTLANNLAAGLRISRETAENALVNCGVSERARPHDLTEEQWLALTEKLG